MSLERCISVPQCAYALKLSKSFEGFSIRLVEPACLQVLFPLEKSDMCLFQDVLSGGVPRRLRAGVAPLAKRHTADGAASISCCA